MMRREIDTYWLDRAQCAILSSSINQFPMLHSFNKHKFRRACAAKATRFQCNIHLKTLEVAMITGSHTRRLPNKQVRSAKTHLQTSMQTAAHHQKRSRITNHHPEVKTKSKATNQKTSKRRLGKRSHLNMNRSAFRDKTRVNKSLTQAKRMHKKVQSTSSSSRYWGNLLANYI